MTMAVGSDRRTRGVIASIALLVLIAVVGCAASTEMTNLWKDPHYKSGLGTRVLVVAVRKDPVRRRMWEDAFTQELTARGDSATASYQLFPDAAPDTQAVIGAVSKDGYSAVLVSSRLSPQTQVTYIPGTLRRAPMTVQDYMGRFHTYWTTVEEPGYTETDEIHRFQTDLWTTANGGRLIWSGELRTLESLSNKTVSDAVSKHIMPVLQKQGLVPPKKS